MGRAGTRVELQIPSDRGAHVFLRKYSFCEFGIGALHHEAPGRGKEMPCPIVNPRF